MTEKTTEMKVEETSVIEAVPDTSCVVKYRERYFYVR